jgi:hypothetical protein
VSSHFLTGCIPFWVHDYYSPSAGEGIVKKSTCYESSGPPDTIEFKPNGVTVKVINGDIIVTKNGKDTKITSWGYNSEPVRSPDENKIAYLSKSKESIENENSIVRYGCCNRCGCKLADRRKFKKLGETG